MQLRYQLRRAFPARVLVAALIAAGGLVIVAPAMSASASPTCHGYTCHGHDPVVYGCAVSSQKFAYYYSGRTLMATLTNEYSYQCNANWVQGQLSKYAVALGWNFAITLTTSDSKGYLESMCWSGPASDNNTGNLEEFCDPQVPPFADSSTNPAWTDMVDGTNYTYGGMQIDDAYGNKITIIAANQ